MQKAQHDQHSKTTQGDFVFIRDFHRGAVKPTWLPDTVIQQDGRPNYKVKLSDNQIVRRHADHIRARDNGCEDDTQHEDLDDVPPFPVIQPTPVNTPASVELCRSQSQKTTRAFSILGERNVVNRSFTHELFC